MDLSPLVPRREYSLQGDDEVQHEDMAAGLLCGWRATYIADDGRVHCGRVCERPIRLGDRLRQYRGAGRVRIRAGVVGHVDEMNVLRHLAHSHCMCWLAAGLTLDMAAANMHRHAPRKSGSAKVVCPLPPYIVPSKEKSAWFWLIGKKLTIADGPAFCGAKLKLTILISAKNGSCP